MLVSEHWPPREMIAFDMSRQLLNQASAASSSAEQQQASKHTVYRVSWQLRWAHIASKSKYDLAELQGVCGEVVYMAELLLAVKTMHSHVMRACVMTAETAAKKQT